MWRRLLVFAAIAIWSGVEAAYGNWMWAAVFGAGTVYLGWAFFIAFDNGPAKPSEKAPKDD